MITPTGNNNPFYDEATEQALLGSLLEKPVLIPAITLELPGEVVFYNTAHQLIYRAILKEYERRGAVDPVIVGEAIKAQGDANRIGGLVYLYDLVESIPVTALATQYAGILKEKYQRRCLATYAKNVILGVQQPDLSPEVIREQFISDTQGIRASQEYLLDAEKSINKTLESHEAARKMELTSFPTRFERLDKYIRIRRGQWGVIGGIPGIGKSTLRRQMIAKFLERGLRCVLFTTEMTQEEEMNCFLSLLSSVPYSYVSEPQERLASHEPPIQEASETIRGYKDLLWIDDSPGLTPEGIANSVRLIALKTGKVDVVILDQMQAVRGQRDREDTRNFMDRLVYDCIQIAREFSCAFISLSHLSREWAHVQRPSMNLFKESGAIEYFAFWAMILWRSPVANFPTFIGNDKIIDCHILKNRFGMLGVTPLVHQGYQMQFRDFTNEERDLYNELRQDAKRKPQDDDDVPY